MEASIYLRKSVLKEDKDAESIDVQRQMNLKAAKQQGWTVTAEYIDAGKTASKDLWKREAFTDLIKDIEAGKVKRIIVREQDRFSRNNADFFNLMPILAKHEVTLIDSAGRKIGDDLISAMTQVFNSHVSKDIQKKIKDKLDWNAAQGKPHGSKVRPYGYTKGFTDLVPEEVKVLKEVKRRILTGESRYAIVKDLNRRGIKGVTGVNWSTRTITRTIKHPRYAGLREHNGEIVGKAQWQAIWTPAEREQILKHLEGGKAYAVSNAPKHLLSGVVICGKCGARLAVKRDSYVCDTSNHGCGGVKINKPALDTFFIKLACRALAELPATDEPTVDDITPQIDAIDAKLAEALALWNADSIPTAVYLQRQASLEAQRRELVAQQPKVPKLATRSVEAFLAADVHQQRATIASLLPQRHVAVLPAEHRGQHFNPEKPEKRLKFN